MSQDIQPSIASIFSILPSQQAKDAEQELLLYYRQAGSSTASLQTHWAEFDCQGRLIRAGRSDLEYMNTEVYLDDNTTEEVKHLITVTQRSNFKVGLIEKNPDKEQFIWFIPIASNEKEIKVDNRIKGLSISNLVFNFVVEMFNHRTNLTQAEKRILFQITAGCSLKESAITDGVSIETKRAHVKHACNKLECKGQTDVVRLMLGQIVHLISLTAAETGDTELVENYSKRYFDEKFQFSVKRLPNGRLLRILECGPSDGQPLILIHGMLYPLMLCHSMEHLKKANIRLIMPIRHGFLEARPAHELYKSGNLLEKTLTDIALYIENYFSKPIPVMGQSMGSVIAMRLACEYPKLVKQLLCASINQAKAHPNTSQYNRKFYNGLAEILSKPGLMRMVSWQFRKHYTNEKNARKILRRMFSDCSEDVMALDKPLGNQVAYAWFRDSYQDSIVGIAEDFSFIMNSENYSIEKIEVPITFIQGDADPMTTIEALKSLINGNTHCTVETIKGAGHLTYSSHSEEFWSLVNASL